MHAPVRSHPSLSGSDEAFALDARRNRNGRIEIERHAVPIQFRGRVLFMPAREYRVLSGELLGCLARGRAFGEPQSGAILYHYQKCPRFAFVAKAYEDISA
jgi:hypothetical protein